MDIQVEFGPETYWPVVKVGGTSARRVRTSEGTRIIYKCGSNHLCKVDSEIAQSISEFHNYWNTPEKWRKFLAPVVAWGELDETQHLEASSWDGRARRMGWVVQRRIPILRAREWQYLMYDARSHMNAGGWPLSRWCKMVDSRANMLGEFAYDLVQQATDWCDAGDRQWSMVHGTVCVHDYASCSQRTPAEYAEAAEKWEDFDDKWDRWAHLLEPTPRGRMWNPQDWDDPETSGYEGRHPSDD